MFGKLKGIIDEKESDHLTLDVGGVGYEVFCNPRTLADMPGTGEGAQLWIETVVREDFIKLYGFASAQERAWFRLLVTVQGVGAKVALAILSTLRPSELARALAAQDKTGIARTPGVGPKLAARIVQELKDKSPAGLAGFVTQDTKRDEPENQSLRDAVSALVNLGYGQAQAGAAVSVAVKTAGPEAAAERLIRLALRELSTS
jgi:Holliday junction DNA helicase RuvA